MVAGGPEGGRGHEKRVTGGEGGRGATKTEGDRDSEVGVVEGGEKR